VSARCPEGHLSQDPDYCDQCGIRITSGQDSYDYRSEDRGAPVGSYGGGSGRGGGGGGYDPLGIPRDSNPGSRGGPRGGDPYGGDQYGYGGGGGYDERQSRPSSYAADGYDQGTYGRGGRDDRDDRSGLDSRDAGGYGARGGRDDQDYARGSRDASDDGYGRGRDDGYGRGGRDGYGDAGRDQQYGRDGGDGYPRGDRDAGYGGGRDASGRDASGRDASGRDTGAREASGRGARDGYADDRSRGGYEADPLGMGERDRGAARGDDRSGGRYPQCPNCRAYYEPGARFCENCGLDFTTGHMPGGGGAGTGRRQTNPPMDAGYGEPHINRNANSWNGGGGGGAATTVWEAVVEAEREYYDSGDDHRVPFPSFYPRRVFPLNGPRLLVGRRSESRGIHPEIDLSGAPEDPGISRAHAIFERQPDGSFALLDPGSTNGTRLNDEPEPIEPHGSIPLQDGDRVYLGAWTRITVRAR
jgi:hypothetical protein